MKASSQKWRLMAAIINLDTVSGVELQGHGEVENKLCHNHDEWQMEDFWWSEISTTFQGADVEVSQCRWWQDQESKQEGSDQNVLSCANF